MSKTFALMAATLAIGAASLLMVQSAAAGASASAPSKYSQSRQVAATQHVRKPQQSGFAVTEFSSASKTTSPKR